MQWFGVFLSCSNLESAKELSKVLDNRKIIASDEPVKVFSDGTVESGKWFEIEGTTKREVDNPTPPKASTDKGKYVRMGGSKLQLEYPFLSKFDDKFIDYMSKFDNANTNPNNQTKVWRVLRDNQPPTEPVTAKSNTGLTKAGTPYTIDGHVKNGSRTNTVTPYISSWTNKEDALKYALHNGHKKVIEIDLSKFKGNFIDLSVESVRNNLLTGTARNFAAASSEFLIITNEIPLEAFKVIN